MKCCNICFFKSNLFTIDHASDGENIEGAPALVQVSSSRTLEDGEYIIY